MKGEREFFQKYKDKYHIDKEVAKKILNLFKKINRKMLMHMFIKFVIPFTFKMTQITNV